ncbi:hypothetical protein T261_8283 [Streptomyces lydicus]|nr:hypothetical protein T261_8283 [Streptomyces lydicus]
MKLLGRSVALEQIDVLWELGAGQRLATARHHGASPVWQAA